MTTVSKRWVVDASVGIKLFVPESYSDEAQALFNPSDGITHELVVLDLFYAECANILWKYVRRFGYPPSEARKNMTTLKNMELNTVASSSIAEKALETALRLEISAYDACYVALAEELRSPLVTADKKLFKRLKKGPTSLKWIGDFSKSAH